ncbi:MAG: NTP transferase domain-containing protein [Candidatus Bathyarchaeota archaeon]|nr:NTP transferase domain-containing protein [Candidatus Bathyarchaeota archaeon]
MKAKPEKKNANTKADADGLRVPALVMAGGRGKRIGMPVEKPLLPLLGKPLIDWVTDAAKSAGRISEVYVVTSGNTAETEKHCVERGLRVVRTDAKGYHDDLKQAIAKTGIDSSVLTVSSDVPALTGRFLDRVVLMYEKNGVDALTVLVPVEKRKKMGLSVSSVYPFGGADYCVSGINVINGKKSADEKLSERAFITEEIEAVLNVNTLNDLEIATKVLTQRKNR